jgi:hypothetical protein
MQKAHATWADCGDFMTCGEIQAFMRNAPQAKANLEKLRA